MHEGGGCGRAAAHDAVDGDHVADAAAAGVAAAELAAVGAAVADRQHQLRIGRGVVDAPQCGFHVPGHRTGHEQQVGMARRGDEVHAETLDAVVGVVERVNLQLAAVARAGIDGTDRQAAVEQFADARLQFLAHRLEGRVGGRRRLGDYADFADFVEDPKHRWSLPDGSVHPGKIHFSHGSTPSALTNTADPETRKPIGHGSTRNNTDKILLIFTSPSARSYRCQPVR